jgi:hypothetical protein
LKVHAEFTNGRGTQWDERVVDAMLAMLEEKRAAVAPDAVSGARRQGVLVADQVTRVGR